MTPPAGSQFRPVVQQAIAVHQNAHERHGRIVALYRAKGKGKFHLRFCPGALGHCSGARLCPAERDQPQGLAKPTRWNTPDAAGLFNMLRLALCTQPRSNFDGLIVPLRLN
jgi:hypothetical protein